MNALKSNHLATFEIILDKNVIDKLCASVHGIPYPSSVYYLMQWFLYKDKEFSSKDKESSWGEIH